MAATKTIGHMQDFNPANETVMAYIERCHFLLRHTQLRRINSPLIVVGSEYYSLLRRLVSPVLPKDKTLDDLVAILKKHYNPETIVIAKRFYFYQREHK